MSRLAYLGPQYLSTLGWIERASRNAASKRIVDRIMSEQIPAQDGGGWAFGFETRAWNGVRFVGHNGFLDGAYNQVDMYTSPGYTVIVLSNTDTSGAGAIANKLRLLLMAGRARVGGVSAQKSQTTGRP